MKTDTLLCSPSGSTIRGGSLRSLTASKLLQ